MPRRLLDFIEMRRFKMAYFIYQSGPIEASKSQIERAFGYTSVGNFYQDWDYLVNEGIVVEEGGKYKLGQEGKREFRAFTALNLALALSIAFSFIFLGSFLKAVNGVVETPASLLLATFLQVFLAVICYYSLNTFTPRLPPEARALKSRGWISRLLRRNS